MRVQKEHASDMAHNRIQPLGLAGKFDQPRPTPARKRFGQSWWPHGWQVRHWGLGAGKKTPQNRMEWHEMKIGVYYQVE
jgi:hypothetical protein